VTLVLGVETSCDETSAAVVEGAGGSAELRSLVILSQDVHRSFGGVVPELASRAHLTSVVPGGAARARRRRRRGARRGRVAVTHAPGLVGRAARGA
jgi:N6-L-threonylcarbamoyladenine synthase